ncbi:MAG TPA: GNAT family N-acetyltransferase [Gaiellaceae bacterium]|nr:GNAT family N-acetyltransferase [Gaiellaceae bacterium]
MDLALGDFRDEHGETVVGWVRSATESLTWSSVPFLRLDTAVLDEWHAQPGVVPCVAMVGDELCAYGQVLEDHSEDEAEVTRVIVAPDRRGQGVGQAFARLLAEEARRRGFSSIFARAVRGDRVTFACYDAAGFVRMTWAEEASLNVDQDQEYVWLRFAPGLASS